MSDPWEPRRFALLEARLAVVSQALEQAVRELNGVMDEIKCEQRQGVDDDDAR